MGRKSVEINPESGKRVKELLDDVKMTQIELAKRLNYTPQQISRIVQGKSRLTEYTAQRIVDVCKTEDSLIRTRYEWLMCYDDLKTESDEWDAERERSARIEVMWETLLEKIARDAGYKFECKDITLEEFLQQKENYFFTDSNGHTTGFSWFDTEESSGYVDGMQSLQYELFAYGAFRLKRMIQKKNIEWDLGDNDGGNKNG